jgi:hypothetical protein
MSIIFLKKDVIPQDKSDGGLWCPFSVSERMSETEFRFALNRALKPAGYQLGNVILLKATYNAGTDIRNFALGKYFDLYELELHTFYWTLIIPIRK